MKTRNKTMNKICLTLAAALMGITLAHAAPQEGTDYVVLSKPITPLQSDKIEVLEFFSYTCVHCYNLDPILLKHSRSFGSDTYLRTEHVVWDPSMLGFARIAAAINASGAKHQANPAVFEAVFEHKINLGDPATFQSWAAQQTRFDQAKVLSAFNSPENATAAKRMQELTIAHGIDATPMVIVGGKYRVQMRDYQHGMHVIDQLIDKVRQERGNAPAATAKPVPKSIGASLAQAANR